MNEFVFILVVVGIIGLLLCFLIDRVISPWQQKRKFEKFLKSYCEGKIKPPHFDTTIHFDESKCETTNDKSGEPSPQILWSEIVRVTAYKRDLFSIDLICVFLSRVDDTGLEIHEDMNNWKDFIAALPKYLPGCMPAESWFPKVASPAFATNLMELFSLRAK